MVQYTLRVLFVVTDSVKLFYVVDDFGSFVQLVVTFTSLLFSNVAGEDSLGVKVSAPPFFVGLYY